MGKAFEKPKTIEDKGQNQIDALKDLKDQNKQLDDLLHSKERGIFKNIAKGSIK